MQVYRQSIININYTCSNAAVPWVAGHGPAPQHRHTGKSPPPACSAPSQLPGRSCKHQQQVQAANVALSCGEDACICLGLVGGLCKSSLTAAVAAAYPSVVVFAMRGHSSSLQHAVEILEALPLCLRTGKHAHCAKHAASMRGRTWQHAVLHLAAFLP